MSDDLEKRLRYCRICYSTGKISGKPCPRCNGSVYVETADELARLRAEVDGARLLALRDGETIAALRAELATLKGAAK